jgi:metallo-beta-lactamase family protein
MKVKFCGAAGTVTGSSHLITLDTGYKILLDCGLYQGYEEAFDDFNKEWLFDPKEIDCLILSHAHIDHCGRIPKLVKDGFKGKIICTYATRDLCSIMLVDSAYIQERDADFINRKVKGRKVEPLYTVRDARVCMENFVTIGYDRWFWVTKGVQVMFRDAGHILGSSSVTLKVRMDEFHDKYIGFTGDIGRPRRPILRDPVPMDPVDYLICESTYGGKEHGSNEDNEQRFLEVINRTCVEGKGKLIIPAFSVGRTQEIVYILEQLESRGKLPRIPIFVDSPLAVNATEIFRLHPECFDEELNDYMQMDPNPFGFFNLKYIRKVEESKALNELSGGAIIISASGMMSAGRVRHHIFNNIEKKNTTILVVGYCAPNTLGGHIANKPERVKIFGVEKRVNASIELMNSFSAHGDTSEMLDFLQQQDKQKLKKLFLVHGEPKRQQSFRDILQEKGFRHVEIPHLGQTYNL